MNRKGLQEEAGTPKRSGEPWEPPLMSSLAKPREEEQQAEGKAHTDTRFSFRPEVKDYTPDVRSDIEVIA